MNYGHQLEAPLGVVPSIRLRAEIILLIVITIFGIIGLSVCLGAYGDHGDLSSGSTSIHLEDTYHAGQMET